MLNKYEFIGLYSALIATLTATRPRTSGTSIAAGSTSLEEPAVIDAYAPLDQRWSRQLSHLDIAIDTIPRMQLRPDMYFPEEIVADGPVPLGRLIPAGIDRVGNPTRPCVVVFRRPIERRVSGRVELDQMLQYVLTRLVAVYLGIDPVEVDPSFDENFL